MNILLLGEYSGLYKNLKEGLEELGHQAHIASSGDGYKKLQSDIDFTSSIPGVIGKFHRKVNPLISIPKLRNYDVVQLINPFCFFYTPFINNLFFDKIIAQNEKFFISAAGDDAYFWKYGRERLRYGPFDDFLKYDLKRKNCILESKKLFDFNSRLVAKSRGIIPIMYEYEESYRDCEKRLKTIPIPINLDKIAYKENIIKDKIVVFHGLNRYGFKGTRFVKEAFSILRKRYPNDLDLVIEGNLPIDDYLALMAKTNIVIDQTNSYSCGVNGIYALAMGKVVLGGAEPESLKSHGVNHSPVVNVLPSVESIVREVEKILELRNDIGALGESSRVFAEKNHCHIKIAEQYVKLWNDN